MKWVGKIIAAVIFLSSAGFTYAQVNYKLHSIFIYKFTQYIEWPDKASGGEFVIAVVGSSPIQAELEGLAATKKVGAKNIVVKKLTPSSDFSTCHIIFLAEGQSSHLSSIAGKVVGKPILFISEVTNGAKKGAGINLIIVDDKMKFEMNKGSVEKQGLKVSGDLVKLAVQVE
ncbi:MAG: YfiR family protein [Cytophagaceae bacterium]|jgi:hypothetical protein|nr:YfiR family protein [Cytophagaceae bacterium]